MFKRTIAALTILAAVLCLAVRVDAADIPRHTKDDTWLVYMYICGTDLEENGQATQSIVEMEQVKLPPNVNVLIYVNGAIRWAHSWIDKKGPGIYLYSSNGLLRKLSSWKADMGSPDTLKKFLKYGEKNFAADHRIMIFWDHGGLNGLCYDDAFDLNPKPEGTHNLTFYDLHKVFGNVYGRSEQKPFELVGFNTCLSASYELANSIADFSRYMVASEPSENGWRFNTWLAELASNTSMNGAQIGQAICDGNMAFYEAVRDETGNDLEAVNAFSVIDLSKMPALRKAYEKYFGEANSCAANQKGFSGAFARAASARNTEKYSGLYMDLGTLAENTKEILPEASANLLDAIHGVVVYNRPGNYLQAHGISTYYPYISSDTSTISQEDFKNFLTQKATPGAQKSLYKKLLKLDVSELQGVSITEDASGNIVAQLTPEQLENVSVARCIIMPVIEDGDEEVGLQAEGVVLFPSDIDLETDWTTGTFTEKFLGQWPTIDGHKITMQLSNEGPLRDFYEAPILLSYKEKIGQDEEGNTVYKQHINEPVILQIAYDFVTQKYSIFGVGSDVENGMVRTMQIILEQGDIITPLFAALVPENSLDADKGNVVRYTDPNTGKSIIYKATLGEPFVYSGNPEITHQPFANGDYVYFFHFASPNGNAALSWPAIINVENGNVTKTIPEPKDLMESSEETDEAA